MQAAAVAPKPTRPLPATLKPLWEKQKAKLALAGKKMTPKSFKVPRKTYKQRVASRQEAKANLLAAEE